ncbi:olfactory marker protein a [Conger conger]|uniref:olfactory marker protein a n=1 Tax=Conger conger TaxID=82655 RepID=UPI002A5A23A0|nr:olfactory marker protein a [Conger conger]
MASNLELPFEEDAQLTEVMRQRVQSLQRSGLKRQDGERLLKPNETVYRLDFSQQSLTFSGWNIRLSGHGKLTITGTSQHWTPDLTHLMTRQLLEPPGLFWRSPEDDQDSPVKCFEADSQEFGERIAELAKIRKVMFFLLAFDEGLTKDKINCSIAFKVVQKN